MRKQLKHQPVCLHTHVICCTFTLHAGYTGVYAIAGFTWDSHMALVGSCPAAPTERAFCGSSIAGLASGGGFKGSEFRESTVQG